jgi:hypothetical protein
MPSKDEQNGLTDPPYFDTLTVKFRGDKYEVALPYCEVANGDIVEINESTVSIAVLKEGTKEVLKMAYTDFVAAVEKAFDIKEIVKLTIQLANSYDTIKIL